jgi:succinoglycan biosynthesis transport protein ExoP
MASHELLRELLGQDNKKTFDAGRYLKVLWQKKWLAMLPLVLSWIISGIGLQDIPLTYLAASSVAIESPSNFTRDLELILDESGGRSQDVYELGRVRADVRNQAFLDEIIVRLGIDQTPILRKRAEQLIEGPLAGENLEGVVKRLAADQIRKRTQVRIGASGVYNIRTESQVPGNAYALNQALTQMYVETRRQRELAEVTAKGDFSDEQVAIYKEKLNRADQDLERFESERYQAEAQGNPVDANNVNLAEEVEKAYREELRNMEARVDAHRTKLKEFFGFVPASDRLLRNTQLDAVENKQIHTMLQNLVRYLATQIRRGGSLAGIVEDTSVGLDRQLYRDILTTMVAGLYNEEQPAVRTLIVDYHYRLMLVSSFKEIVDTLDRYVNNYRQNLSGAPAMEAELERRRAEAEKYRTLFETFQQQSTSAQITRAIQSSQLATRIEVRDHAVHPIEPIRPNKTRLQALFILIGLGAGMSMVLLSEFFNRAFTNIQEIEQDLGLPVLGTIPSMAKGPGKAKIQRRKSLLIWIAAMVLFTGGVSGGMYVLRDMNTQIELHIDREAVEEMG